MYGEKTPEKQPLGEDECGNCETCRNTVIKELNDGQTSLESFLAFGKSVEMFRKEDWCIKKKFVKETPTVQFLKSVAECLAVASEFSFRSLIPRGIHLGTSGEPLDPYSHPLCLDFQGKEFYLHRDFVERIEDPKPREGIIGKFNSTVQTCKVEQMASDTLGDQAEEHEISFFEIGFLAASPDFHQMTCWTVALGSDHWIWLLQYPDFKEGVLDYVSKAKNYGSPCYRDSNGDCWPSHELPDGFPWEFVEPDFGTTESESIRFRPLEDIMERRFASVTKGSGRVVHLVSPTPSLGTYRLDLIDPSW